MPSHRSWHAYLGAGANRRSRRGGSSPRPGLAHGRRPSTLPPRGARAGDRRHGTRRKDSSQSDQHARVPGVPGVYAAGDVTALALKHSTRASAREPPRRRQSRRRRGAMWNLSPGRGRSSASSPCPHFPAAPVRPGSAVPSPSATASGGRPGTWRDAPRALPRICGPWGQTRPRLAPQWDPHRRSDGRVRRGGSHRVDCPDGGEHPPGRDHRRLMAVRRAEREGEKLEHALERRGEEFDRHERAVVLQLRAAGYLREA